jgi:hypothetical protein
MQPSVLETGLKETERPRIKDKLVSLSHISVQGYGFYRVPQHSEPLLPAECK